MAWKLEYFVVGIVLLFLFLIGILSSSIGTPDIGDYGGVSKFFAGELNSDIRASHSFFYGLIHFPFLKLVENFWVLRIINIFYLIVLAMSLYFVSGRDTKLLYLFLLAPVVWYLTPFVNPLGLSALLFFWGYVFIKKFLEKERIGFLIVSGIFVGLAWAFWDAILFFSLFLGLAFLYNRKAYYFLVYGCFVLLGLLPKLIVDQLLFGFAFFGIIRYFFGIISVVLFQGVYGADQIRNLGLGVNLILLFLFLPLFGYKLFYRREMGKNKSVIFFLVYSLLLIFINFQIRILILVLPILLYELSGKFSNREYRIMLIVFGILSGLVVAPYIIGVSSSSDIGKFDDYFSYSGLNLRERDEVVLARDLESIAIEFTDEKFIVGPGQDDYLLLALVYWGSGIEEFVSLQDYELYLAGEDVIFSRGFETKSTINNRRAIFVTAGLKRNTLDTTEFGEIEYGISLGNNLGISGFEVVKKYERLTVYRKN